MRIDATVWDAPEDAAAIGAPARASAADGVVQIECTLLDEHGDVARGERVVTAEVDGGELLGLENGDLRDNTPYTASRRRTLDGRVIVFVRRGERDRRRAQRARPASTSRWSGPHDRLASPVAVARPG